LADGRLPAGRHRDEDYRRRSGHSVSGTDKSWRTKLANEQAEAEHGDPFMRSLQNAAVTQMKVIGEIVKLEIKQRRQARREASRATLLDAPRNERRVEDDRRARLFTTPPGLHGRNAHQSRRLLR
jgi:hypothetical protein